MFKREELYNNPDEYIMDAFKTRIFMFLASRLRKLIKIYIGIIPNDITGKDIDGKLNVKLSIDDELLFEWTSDYGIIQDYILDSSLVIKQVNHNVLENFDKFIHNKYFKY